MNGRLLLDTNIVIAIFSNDTSVINSLGKIEEVFVPTIVLGELYYGAHKSISIIICDTDILSMFLRKHSKRVVIFHLRVAEDAKTMNIWSVRINSARPKTKKTCHFERSEKSYCIVNVEI